MEDPEAAGSFTPRHKNYALLVLSSMYLLTITDRPMMGLLLQPIKDDLRLSDTEAGLLVGLGFGIVYSLAGLWIGRLADRGNRIILASVLLGLWSAACIAASFATSFLQLLLARIVGAFGDASGRPITYSLLGDYFPDPAERTKVMYRWNLAGPFSAVAILGAGWVNEYWGWRAAFLAVGLLGLPVVLATILSLKEPRTLAGHQSALEEVPPLRAVFDWLWQSRASRILFAALLLEFVVGSAVGNWLFAFAMRYRDVGTAEIASWTSLGLPIGIAAALLGQWIAARWLSDKLGLQLILMGLCFALAGLASLAQFLIPGKTVFFLLFYVQALLNAPFAAAPYVVFQAILPPRMRTTAMMIIMTVCTMVGLAIGPLFVGALSDYLQPHFGDASLKWALIGFPFLSVLCGLLFAMAARPTERELAAGTAEQGA